MTKIFKSRLTAWLAFALVIVLLVVTFRVRTVWWAFIDIFFAFMAAFVNLVAVNVRRLNPVVSARLNTAAFIFGILFIVAFLAEWIISEAIF